MASVNFEKLKSSQQVKAMFRHCDIAERLKATHSNTEINKNITKTNMQIKNRSYQTTCDLYDKRIAYLDSLPNANKRKDRVTCFGLNVPIPSGLNKKDELKWFAAVIDIVKMQYGANNLLQAYIHRDEKHSYLDAENGEQKQSRTHAHFYVIPEHEGKLNGKWFSSRENMLKINKSIQEMTQSDFGIDFMDGTKRKSKKSVESLKNQSREKELDALETRLKAQETILRQQAIDIQVREKNILKRELELSEREKNLSEREKKNDVLIRLGRKAASMGISTVDVQTESTQRRFPDIGMGY